MKEQKNEGITLIALIVTIIVLLILAAVAISTLTGEHGILTQTQNSKKVTDIAEVKEQAQLDIVNWVAERLKNQEDTTLDDATVKSIIEDANKDNTNKYYAELTDTSIITKQGNEILFSELYGESGYISPAFNENTLTIGEAINTDKYGWKVPEYTVTTDEFTTGIWRLFYQDSNYTYLITDECVGNYIPSDYYTTITNEDGELKYQTGADVSIIGQKLNPIISSLFTSNNTSIIIRATAWLTDTSDTGMWSDYKNSDAVFAIGSPTAELFANSYNATGKSNTITLTLGNNGGYNSSGSKGLSVDDNYGIYNKSTSSSWWLASPEGFSFEMIVLGSNDSFSGDYVSWCSDAVRPIVCIPTSVFQSKYTLENV